MSVDICKKEMSYMNYSYEIVTTPKRIPAKIVIHTDPGVVLKHWHKDLELTYLYKGSATFSTNGRISSIGSKELFLVNSGDVHSVIDYGDDVVTMITILISYNFIKDKCADIDNFEFTLEEKNKNIKRLKDINEEIANMYIKDMEINNTPLVFVDDENSNDKFHYLKIESLLYEILYILLNDFSLKKDTNLELKNERNLERLKIITDYIDENYKDNISLDEIAANYQLSKEYLATIFKKYMGITVGTYLKNMRLTSAYRDLMNSDYSINQLAFDNGFPNIKSFINSFKEHYGETPYKYTKFFENN
jgi:AraC family transcriptional regulator, melibiose operon regulatory protein